MGAYKDKNGTWYAQFRFTNWKGEADRKTKRGFATKKEALEREREFLTQSAGNLEMTFEAFYELYKKNLQDRLKKNTWKMKTSVIESKILPYFKKKRMCDIKPRDIVAWQNIMLQTCDDNGEPYSPVYLKTIHNQISAIFNHAVKFYELESTEKPYMVKPYMVKPDMGLPRLETPAQINIDKSITDLSNTHSILSDEVRPSVLAALEAKRKETEYRDMDMYREIIKENIGYEYLLSDLPYDHDRLEEILELLVETVCSTNKYIRVAGSDYPAEVVRSRLLKLDMEHIKFVFNCLKENTTKIRNIKQYLLTTLYNAPTTIGSYYSALVQHDLYGSSRD